eukprot:gene15270-21352_t
MTSLPPEVSLQLTRFQSAAEGLEQVVPSLTHTVTHLSDLKGKGADESLLAAQAYLALAQSAHTLYNMLLRTQGRDPEETKKEDERLSRVHKRVTKSAAAKELREARPTVTLDIGAANRFINAAIPELSAEQRQLLKDATLSIKRSAAEPGHRIDKKRIKTPQTTAGMILAPKAKEAAAQFLNMLKQGGEEEAEQAGEPKAKEAAAEFLDMLSKGEVGAGRPGERDPPPRRRPGLGFGP